MEQEHQEQQEQQEQQEHQAQQAQQEIFVRFASECNPRTLFIQRCDPNEITVGQIKSTIIRQLRVGTKPDASLPDFNLILIVQYSQKSQKHQEDHNEEHDEEEYNEYKTDEDDRCVIFLDRNPILTVRRIPGTPSLSVRTTIEDICRTCEEINQGSELKINYTGSFLSDGYTDGYINGYMNGYMSERSDKYKAEGYKAEGNAIRSRIDTIADQHQQEKKKSYIKNRNNKNNKNRMHIVRTIEKLAGIPEGFLTAKHVTAKHATATHVTAKHARNTNTKMATHARRHCLQEHIPDTKTFDSVIRQMKWTASTAEEKDEETMEEEKEEEEEGEMDEEEPSRKRQRI